MDNYPKFNNIETPPSLQEIAFQAIKETIIKDEFKPGEVYSERVVAKILGISKTPVHHALLDLAYKGLVTILPQKGFRVNVLSAKEADNLYIFRLALEKAVLIDITPSLTRNDLRVLHDIVTRLTESKEPMVFQLNDRAFHMYLASLTANTYIIDALERVWDLSDWMGTRAISSENIGYERIIQEHTDILERLEQKDTDQALTALEAHIEFGVSRFRNALKGENKPV